MTELEKLFKDIQNQLAQTLVSSRLYANRVILHEIEKLENLKNHNNFNVNITFLENYVQKDNNNIKMKILMYLFIILEIVMIYFYC